MQYLLIFAKVSGFFAHVAILNFLVPELMKLCRKIFQWIDNEPQIDIINEFKVNFEVLILCH